MTLGADRLHVIRCYERLPPMSGGMERHISELTAAQRRQGVRVTELFNSGMPTGESFQIWSGLRVDRVRPALLRAGIFYLGAAMKRIDSSDNRTRVLHVHGDWPAFLFGDALGRLLGVRAAAASLHECLHSFSSVYAWVLNRYDPIFTTGLHESTVLTEVTGKPVIHLPSAPAELFFVSPTYRGDPVDVIVVGSLTARKNMEAVLELAAQRPQLTFVVYGDGPERVRLEILRVQRKLNNLQFRGAVGPEDIHAAMCTARLFVNTAFAEGSPTAALEAMASGLPVILTPSNDYSRIVEQGKNGRVTQGWSVDELTRSVDEFLDDPQRLADAGYAARKVAQIHRWDVKATIVTNAMIAAAERHGSFDK